MLTARVSILCLLLMGTMAWAADAPESAKKCADCHGEGGVSKKRSDVPTIAGASDFYIEGQLDAYQKKQRPCTRGPDDKTDMCEVAEKLSDAQVKEVSAYFAGQKFVAATQTTDAALAAKGKTIHAANCEKCHTEGGSVAADDAGILAGQPKSYLETTFKEMSEGKRPQSDKMKAKTSKLSGEDFKALAEFYASGGK